VDRHPQDQAAQDPAAPIPQVDVETAAERLRQGAVLVDVREPDEFDEVHAEGALLIPLGDVPERRGEIPPDQDTLLICRSGARSQRAAEYLAGLGHRVANVAGGTLAWVERGLPVRQGR
jgi:rhodanese-related sulfurtransferase